MRIIIMTTKFWLGLWMLFWGLNWFVDFVPQPPGGPGSQELHYALMHSGLFTGAKILEIFFGLSLLSNRLVPFALVVCAPVTAIVGWIHVLDGPGAPGYFVVFSHIFLLCAYLPYYEKFLVWNSQPLNASAAWKNAWTHFLSRKSA